MSLRPSILQIGPTFPIARSALSHPNWVKRPNGFYEMIQPRHVVLLLSLFKLVFHHQRKLPELLVLLSYLIPQGMTRLHRDFLKGDQRML